MNLRAVFPFRKSARVPLTLQRPALAWDGPRPACGAMVPPRGRGPGPRALLTRSRSFVGTEAPCRRVRTPAPRPPAPAASPEPSETARQAGALLPGEAGGCLVCDLIKGRGRTHRQRRAGPSGHSDWAGAILYPLVRSPGARAFPPSQVNASESGAGACGRGFPRALPLAGPPRRRRCLSRPPKPHLRSPLLDGLARTHIEPDVIP